MEREHLENKILERLYRELGDAVEKGNREQVLVTLDEISGRFPEIYWLAKEEVRKALQKLGESNPPDEKIDRPDPQKPELHAHGYLHVMERRLRKA